MPDADKIIVLPITRLLLRSRPSAIRWLVVTVIVFAIYAVQPTWALSHISNEVSEGFTPAFTYRYSPSSIEAVVSIAGIVTTFP